jgi:ABC-type protease/lipase transport system fused ATPase/permease subunit
MLQVFDRVLASQSTDTLLVQSLLAITALLTLAVANELATRKILQQAPHRLTRYNKPSRG